MDIKEILDILTNIVLIGSFIGVFYFTIGKTIEGQITASNSQVLVNSFTQYLDFLDPSIRTFIGSNIVPNVDENSLQQQDAQTAVYNQTFVNKAIKYLGSFFAVGIFVIIGTALYNHIPLKVIFIPNLIILFFIALTEFCFLYFIGRNYIIADPNLLKLNMYNTILHNT